MLIPLVYAFSTSGQITTDSKYPGLFNGSLKLSILDSLPVGDLLIAGNIKITQAQLDSEIKKASASLQPQLKDNLFFLLESVAIDRLLNAEVRDWAVSKKINTKNMKDQDVIKKYVEELTTNITVSADEVKKAYDSDPEVYGGAKFSDAEPYIKSQLIDEKKQEVVENHVNNLGKRIVIKVNDDWVKAQYPKAIDNLVDKARRSGKPSLVDFGASGCRPCDMMAPMLEELKKEYTGIMNIEFVDVRERQILGARYGVSSIPVQVFFDKDGKEFYRHVGFIPKNNILAKLKEMGVSK
ncbi:MAG: Thioredoxin protein [Candidatus Poribacteria bacterium]|nr:Thioredoxin protein [Candidatus Poribacteria bacterium]